MNIDPSAPLHARQDILIAAPLEHVWNLQTDINRWQEWQPDVASAKLEGPLKSGTVFRWKAAGLGITSTLQHVEPMQRIGWTGDSLGMKAVHNWTFQPEANGTRVTTEESITGWLARLLKLFDANYMEKSLQKSLSILKTQAEKS